MSEGIDQQASFKTASCNEQVEDPWRNLAAGILLEAITDAEHQREMTSRYARFEARQWLLESDWAWRLCEEIEISHQRIRRWVLQLPPLEPEEYPPPDAYEHDQPNRCVDCGTEISQDAQRCLSCAATKRWEERREA